MHRPLAGPPGKPVAPRPMPMSVLLNGGTSHRRLRNGTTLEGFDAPHIASGDQVVIPNSMSIVYWLATRVTRNVSMFACVVDAADVLPGPEFGGGLVPEAQTSPVKRKRMRS